MFLRPSEKDGLSEPLNARIASIIVVFPALFAPVIIVRPLPNFWAFGIANGIVWLVLKPRNPEIRISFIICDANPFFTSSFYGGFLFSKLLSKLITYCMLPYGSCEGVCTCSDGVEAALIILNATSAWDSIIFRIRDLYPPPHPTTSLFVFLRNFAGIGRSSRQVIFIGLLPSCFT